MFSLISFMQISSSTCDLFGYDRFEEIGFVFVGPNLGFPYGAGSFFSGLLLLFYRRR